MQEHPETAISSDPTDRSKKSLNGLFERMASIVAKIGSRIQYKSAMRAILKTMLASGLLCAGCATSGIIKNPDLRKLSYDRVGRLRYEGEEVEGIKLKLPWYIEMYPDNAAEWGFTLFTFGAGIGLGSATSGSSGGDGGEESATPSSTTQPSGSSGGGGGGSSGGGGDTGGGDTGGGGGDETPW